MATWDQIRQHPSFVELPWEEKETVARNYFQQSIAGHQDFQVLGEDERRRVKTNLMRSFGPDPDPGVMESLFNSFVTNLPGAAASRASMLDLGAYALDMVSKNGGQSAYAASKRLQEDIAFDAPARGAAGFIGAAAGSTVPAAVAVGAGLVVGGPVALAAGAATALYFAAQSMGMASRIIKNWEDETGEDISAPSEAMVMVGFGASAFLMERLGMGAVSRNLLNKSPLALQALGKSLMRNNIPEAARIIAKNALIEGAEEVGEQAIQNALVKMNINGKQGLSEGLLESFGGGVIGGGLAFAPLAMLRKRRATGIQETKTAKFLRPGTYGMMAGATLREIKGREAQLAGLLPERTLTGQPGGFVYKGKAAVQGLTPQVGAQDALELSLAREEMLRRAGVLSEASSLEVKIAQRLARLAAGVDPEDVPILEPLDAIALANAAKGQEPNVPISDRVEPIQVGGEVFTISDRTKLALVASHTAAKAVKSPTRVTKRGAVVTTKARAALEEAQAEFVRSWLQDNPDDVTGERMMRFLDAVYPGKYTAAEVTGEPGRGLQETEAPERIGPATEPPVVEQKKRRARTPRVEGEPVTVDWGGRNPLTGEETETVGRWGLPGGPTPAEPGTAQEPTTPKQERVKKVRERRARSTQPRSESDLGRDREEVARAKAALDADPGNKRLQVAYQQKMLAFSRKHPGVPSVEEVVSRGERTEAEILAEVERRRLAFEEEARKGQESGEAQQEAGAEKKARVVPEGLLGRQLKRMEEPSQRERNGARWLEETHSAGTISMDGSLTPGLELAPIADEYMDTMRALRAIAHIFNQDVLFVRGKDDQRVKFAGLAGDEFLLLNADYVLNHEGGLDVLIHELYHRLAITYPAIHERLLERIQAAEPDFRQKYAEWAKEFFGHDTPVGFERMANTEAPADMIAAFMRDKEFWAAVGKDEPGLLKHLHYYFSEALAKIRRFLEIRWGGAQGKAVTRHSLTKFFKNVEAIRNAVAEALVLYKAEIETELGESEIAAEMLVDGGVALEEDMISLEELGDIPDPNGFSDTRYQVRASDIHPKMPLEVRARLVAPLQLSGVVGRVIQTDTQLYSPEGKAVNAAIDVATGTMYLSADVNLATVGHEGFHRLVALLGKEHPVVKGLFKEFGGEEGAAEAVGLYYFQRRLQTTGDERGFAAPPMLRRLAEWLRDMWVAAKADFGLSLTREELVRAANIQLKSLPTGTSSYTGTKYQAPEDALRYQEQDQEDRSHLGNVNLEKNQFILDEASRKLLEEHAESRALDPITATDLNARAEALIKEEGPVGMMRMISNYVSKPAGRGEFSLVSAHAMRIYTDAQLLRSLGQAAKQTDKTVRDFLEQERNMLFDAASNLSADAGRLLNSRRIALTPETLMKYADVLDKKLPKRVREEVVRLLEEGKIKEAEAKLKVPSLQDYIRELYAANLLWSPKTQSVNFGSQTLWLGWQFPHRALVGAVDKGLRSHFMTKLFPQLMGKHQQVFMSEIVPMFAGMKNRNSIIWKAIKERGIMNPDVFGHDITLIEDELGKAWSAWEHAPNPFVRSVGRVLTLPLKIMKTVDLYFKSLAYSAQMEVIAEREFRLHKIPHDQTMQNPTVAQEAEAAEFARYATFMDRPDAITRAMVHIRNKGAWPVMPFIITISNLLKRGIEMTPGVGLVTTGGRSPAEVIAKQIEGAFITLIISAMFFGGDEEDDRITGSQPTNPAERAAFYAQGKIPFAVRFGDRWVSYQRAEPFSLPLAMIANLREKFRRQDREMVLMPPNENDGEVLNRRVNSILDDFGTVATTVVSSVLESSYLDFVDSATRQKGWWREEVKRIPTNMVPGAALWRSLRHVMEPIREEGIASAFYGSRTLRESMDWLDQWAQVIPFGAFLYDESPGRFKLDRFGETIEVTDGALLQWLPFKTSPASWDYTELELARLHRTVGMPYPDYPDRHIQFMGQKVDIGGDIFYEYAALYGAVTKKALVAAMRRPGYRGMSDGRKKEMLEKAVARARRGAAARLRRVLRGEYRSNRIVSSGP